ncbi:MAG TPA: ATP-dependent helicase HrpB [Caulobacteraceae bacterium]|jgi:ATP-dependent helicase HrpB|nr:ATP-dependent helicase HrpB [Caulobacteraceae bacterium]
MLPIEDALPALKDALAERTAAVLVAPPGAGKTTVVPLALLSEPWVAGRRLIVLEPRRLAARAAAARMAQTLGEAVGETVGFRVRMQSKVSARTRIEVVTEGVFTRMILDDPGLEGVAAVLFDEFHERSVDADLGLALARDSQTVLREDLRLLVMSATLDGARVARLLGDAPVIESLGRMFPVATRYLGRDPRLGLVDQTVRAVMSALAETDGGLLVFLPGQGEIRRVADQLTERLRDRPVDIAPLYGALDIRDQDRAIAPATDGRRKVVLATAIAETSLTLQGVRVVVDGGFSRVARYDPAKGLTRLETVRVSQASADQRRGRAGRTEPGVCYRLWDEAETRALPAFARPEILETDLSRLALDLARWGAKSPGDLAFLDPPPDAAWREARGLLDRLGALDEQGDLTAHDRAVAGLPLPPRLAHMVLEGARLGAVEPAARLAVLLGEQGLGGGDVDLRERLTRLDRDGSPRARDAKALAGRWARGAGGTQNAGALADEGLLLATAFPERIAQARGAAGQFLLANGRGAWIEPTDALARERWLAIAELGGGAASDRILSAIPLDGARLMEAFASRITTEDRVRADPAGRVAATRVRRLGRLVIEERRIEQPDPALIAAALLGRVRDEGPKILPWGEAAQRLRTRAAFLRGLDGDEAWPDLSDEALEADVETWLTPLLAGRTRLEQIGADELDQALRGRMGWERLRDLDRLAPEHWTAPTGTRAPIDYAAEGGPRIEIRVQELFGLGAHPAVAGGRVPLTVALLSPARRPIQLTRDLPGFWRGSWADVRKDMRGRYPKHPWPEDPLAEAPTTRVKPRGYTNGP